MHAPLVETIQLPETSNNHTKKLKKRTPHEHSNASKNLSDNVNSELFVKTDDPISLDENKKYSIDSPTGLFVKPHHTHHDYSYCRRTTVKIPEQRNGNSEYKKF